MNFLGRKLNGNFQGEVVSDASSLACRRTGGSLYSRQRGGLSPKNL
jgi:hypothetical protein